MDHCPHCMTYTHDGFDRNLGVCSKCSKPVLSVSERANLQQKLVFDPPEKRDFWPQALAEMIGGGPKYVSNFAWTRGLALAVIALILLDLAGVNLTVWKAMVTYFLSVFALVIVLSFFVAKFEDDFNFYLCDVMDNFERRRYAATLPLDDQSGSKSFECSKCGSSLDISSHECPKCHSEVGFGIAHQDYAGILQSRGAGGPSKLFFLSTAGITVVLVAVIGLGLVAISKNPGNEELIDELQRFTVSSLKSERINESDDLVVAMLKVGCVMDVESCAAGFVQGMYTVEDRNFLVGRYALIGFLDARIACFGFFGEWRCSPKTN